MISNHVKIIWILTLLFILSGTNLFSQADEKPNIIFIIIDDLNDYTSTLAGHPQMETPGLNRLEDAGTTFINAYVNSPKCAPSRTSFLTGKDVNYTNVYNNPACRPFRDFFDTASNNEIVFTIPEHLKNEGGYFTYGINKVYHCFDSEFDFDTVTSDPCNKELSWNKYSMFIGGEDEEVRTAGSDINDGPKSLGWAPIPNEYETKMYDYRAIDSASLFIREIASNPENFCNKPFYMMVGLRKPHPPWYIPEKYFFPDYIENVYTDPFNIPYNFPLASYPINGIILPPQPDTIYSDFNKLGELGQNFALQDSTYDAILKLVNQISPLPEIDPYVTDATRYEILEASAGANGLMAYLASVSFIDQQINRLIDSLENYPEILSNTVIIAISDNGYSLGEKKHWQKGTMWNTDLRVPLIIADFRNPQKQIVESPVSLLDLFPTICEISDTPVPLNPDDDNYLDGKSFFNLIENPELVIERPVLSSYKQQDAQSSCFPQYSVRNSRFHYIRYMSNNVGDFLDCDKNSAFIEEEFYDLGVDLETDPNEWINLIGDESFMPIINYLKQWLPDEQKYLEAAYTIRIKSGELECFEQIEDTLHLSFDLYDTSGILISPPENHKYLWTTNLTSDTTEGINFQLAYSEIDAEVFSQSNKLLVYVQMIDTITNAVNGIDLKYIYINDENIPVASFNLVNTSGLQACVQDYSISGSYLDTWWDFGEGIILEDNLPGLYTYQFAGTYLITNFVLYGNDSCVVEFEQEVTVKNPGAESEAGIVIYPNPVSDVLRFNISTPVYFAQVLVVDLSGRWVISEYYADMHCPLTGELNTADLSPGAYVLVVRSVEGIFQTPFIVLH